MCSKNYPWSIVDVDSESVDVVKKYFKSFRDDNGFLRIGDNGYFFPQTKYKEYCMYSIYNMPVRPSDIYVASFPRSGTTITQELVWLVVNDLDYAKARSKHLVERYVDIGCLHKQYNSLEIEKHKQHNCIHLNKVLRVNTSPAELLTSALDPRFIKSHLPLSLMPKNVLEYAKVIYVARDPRDVAVSLYHLCKLLTVHSFVGDFKTFWDMFLKGLLYRAPCLEHVKEAWAVRDHPNMLFIFYEEYAHDISWMIRKVSSFLGKQLTVEQIAKLAEHLQIENFQKNQSVNIDYLYHFNSINAEAETFIRKGKVGGWRDYFDEQMTEQAEAWIEENLRDTDLKFPKYTKKI